MKMTHQYRIGGMTCMGCLAKVQQALNAIDGLTATVTLEPPIATITMSRHVATDKLQKKLSAAGNYTIAIHHGNTQEKAHPKEHHHQYLSADLAQAKGKYYCPMHCKGEKTYNEPGNILTSFYRSGSHATISGSIPVCFYLSCLA